MNQIGINIKFGNWVPTISFIGSSQESCIDYFLFYMYYDNKKRTYDIFKHFKIITNKRENIKTFYYIFFFF